jgi:hypothetical protein
VARAVVDTDAMVVEIRSPARKLDAEKPDSSVKLYRYMSARSSSLVQQDVNRQLDDAVRLSRKHDGHKRRYNSIRTDGRFTFVH